MGVNTDGKETGPGSTITDGVELTAEACEIVPEIRNEKSLPQDANCDVGIQDQEPAKATGIPLIPFPKVPSQSSVLNTEHNKAQREHADEGESFPCNTSTTLQSDADGEDEKTELSRGAPGSLDTDTFADDICIPLEESTSPLQPGEIMEILETDTNDASDAMHNIQLDEISPSDASAFKLELPFNPDIYQMDREGYTPLYKAALEGQFEGVQDLIFRGANPNKPSKGGLRPLHAAAHEGHAHIVDFLIIQGADVNVGCERGRTPLHTAAARGYVGILESFIAEETNVNMEDHTGLTPFNAAVQYGHLEAVKYLMTQGAKQNRYAGMTPLYAAAELGHLDIVKFLINEGAEVNEDGEKGKIPLLDAAMQGHLKIMEHLIHLGTDFNKEGAKSSTPPNAADQNEHIEAVKCLITEGAKHNRYFGMTPLHAAAEFGHLNVVKYFISEGADVNEEDDKEWIPLHGAAIRGHTDVIEYLIQKGSLVNKKSKLGWTPFNAAVQYGHLEAVKYLMTQGVKQHRYAGMTPLYSAAQFGHLDIVKFFISKGAGVNEEDDKGRIPLQGAAFHGRIEVMEYLIHQGSNVNKADAKGWTPFIAAVQGGHLEAVKYLMTQGAKHNIYAGMTPLYAASRFGHQDVVEFFISNGADVNEEDDKGRIPLHGAAIQGRIEVMEYFIHQGSNVNKADAKGWTPFIAAVQGGHLEAVKYLMTTGEKQNRYDGMTPLHATAQGRYCYMVDYLTLNGADMNVKDIDGLTPLQAAADAGHLNAIEGISLCRGDPVEEETGGSRSRGHQNLIGGRYVTVTMKGAYTQSRTGKVDNAEDGNDYTQADNAKRGADELSLKNLPTRTHDVEENVGRPNVNEYISPRKGDSDAEDAGDPQSGGLHYGAKRLATKSNVMKKKKNKKKEKVVQMKKADTQPRTGQLASHVDNAEDGNDYTQADSAKRGVDELSLKNLPTRAHGVEKYVGRPNVNEHLSVRTGDPNEEDTGDPLSGSHHYGAKHLATRGNVKKKVVEMKDAYKQSSPGQLASQVDNAEEGNDCTQADNTKTEASELSLKNLPTRTHGDVKAGNGEHNPFIHAKLKYPDKGEQDPMLDQIEAIPSPGTMKRDRTTNGTDCSSPHAPQTGQYSGFDPPNLQTMVTDGHPPEESESRCHSIIDENREMRESPSPMNAGNDLPIKETSMELESFPTHPLAVVHHKLDDSNPVSTKGTSSNPVWRIRTKRRTSVYRCPSILALVKTFLQMTIALAILLAGSPVIVAGSDITKRVTLQAGKPGVVPFHLPPSPSDTSQGVSFYTLQFKSKPRPFSNNGKADIEGFKSPSQLPRFTTSVTDLDTSPCVNLMIDNVDTLDEGVYLLTAVWRSFENVRYETMKEIVVQIPPGRAKCYITLSANGDSPYEVHCQATIGSVKPTLSCYQNDKMIDIRGNVTNNGHVIRRIFWLPHITHLSCCSHDVSLNVSETTCNDFVWPPIKGTTRQTVTTVPTSVTTPTPQTESHLESGACRQFMLPSLWHFTYLSVYLPFYVFTMY